MQWFGPLWLVLTFVALGIGLYEAATAPREATMGDLYRVFFYHFPHTILSFVWPYVNCFASLAYLFLRDRNKQRAQAADALAVASAEATVLYASIGLATGMLWGRAAWGIWWAWDARLTTYLLLWLLYVSYLIVRRFSAGGQTALIAAVLAIFAAVDIPICFESIRWWRTQHPAPVFGGGEDAGIDKSMVPAVLWNVGAWLMWGLLIIGVRYVVERRKQRFQDATAMDFLNGGDDTAEAA
jgi:heme exporter protein C